MRHVASRSIARGAKRPVGNRILGGIQIIPAAVALAIAPVGLSASVLAVAVAMVSLTPVSAAAVTGAIQTSVCDGTTVNANLYDDKRAVYLTGGPQGNACGNSNTLAPANTDYYFQVTDPSGAALLSTDPLKCRKIHVNAQGVISGYVPEAGCTVNAPVACALTPTDGPHNSGTGPCVGTYSDQISVQLFPFDDTPNPGGVYKAWITPVDKLADGCDPETTGIGCGGNFGFVTGDTKTDNFRVKASELPPELEGEIDVFKFCDANANGLLDPDELLFGLDNWQINFAPDPNTCSGLTAGGGFLTCASLDPGTYDVSEVLLADFGHSGTCTDGACGTCSIGAAACVNNSECLGTGNFCVPNPSTTASITIMGADIHNVDFGNVGLSSIAGTKTDVNDPTNGIGGVKVTLAGTLASGAPFTPQCAITRASGSYLFNDLLPGRYTVTETPPPNTVPSGPNSCPNLALAVDEEDCAGDSETCNFQNACLGAGGGHTLGFWSNKNGQTRISGADRAVLSALCLVNGAGVGFNPTTNGQIKNWLLSANAVNMSYMLSAQLAAMKLNTLEPGFANGAATIFAGTPPGGCSVPGLVNGFISINDLMSDANSELCADGSTPSGDPERACQGFKKNALDAANNNQNFVVACPDFGATCGP